MPIRPRFSRRRLITNERRVPSGSEPRGVIEHSAIKKPDQANLGGTTGAGGVPVRTSGTNPSIRRGVERSVVIAGTGLAAGTAFAIPSLFGDGGGSVFDPVVDFFDPSPAPGGAGSGDGPGSGASEEGGVLDVAGSALGVSKGFLALALTGAGLIYVAGKAKGGKA